jgi:hypothetical protein
MAITAGQIAGFVLAGGLIGLFAMLVWYWPAATLAISGTLAAFAGAALLSWAYAPGMERASPLFDMLFLYTAWTLIVGGMWTAALGGIVAAILRAIRALGDRL